MSNINRALKPLNDTLVKFNINTPLRIAHFIAQVAHESGAFQYLKEIASGAAYDTGRLAARLGNTPEADGDGQKYKGRGYIQLTGTSNYRLFDEFTGRKHDLMNHPERVEQPDLAMLAAGWYWSRNDLNRLADRDDLLSITKRINGGTNGLEDRRNYLKNAKKVLYEKREYLVNSMPDVYPGNLIRIDGAELQKQL